MLYTKEGKRAQKELNTLKRFKACATYSYMVRICTSIILVACLSIFVFNILSAFASGKSFQPSESLFVVALYTIMMTIIASVIEQVCQQYANKRDATEKELFGTTPSPTYIFCFVATCVTFLALWFSEFDTALYLAILSIVAWLLLFFLRISERKNSLLIAAFSCFGID